MQSLQTIKYRLKGVKSIGQITKAMELVAATKMRRSQETALSSRPYAYAALEFLANLSHISEGYVPRLLQKREVKNTLIVVAASDKGLTGPFNSAIFRAFEKKIGDPISKNYKFVAVGEKAVSYLERQGKILEAAFTKFGDYTNIEEVRPLAELLINGYLQERWDKALVVHTNFKSAMQQEVIVRELFPVTYENLKRTAEEIIPQRGRFAELKEKGFSLFAGTLNEAQEYLIEPSPEEVLESLVPHLVAMQVYHIILEANASEHAARRLAMKNASDNASDIVDSLTLAYNKARQAGITKELTEISAGAETVR